jgi:hypothetical protein
MINKNIAVSLATMLTIGTAAISAKHVLATDTASTNPMSSLVQKIAQKFNLSEADVQAVVDADRAERETQMKAEREADNEKRLAEAVTKGEITEAQKQLILAKQKEIEATRESSKPADMKNLTDDEKTAVKTKMDAQRSALEEWAKTNGIDVKYLMMGGHGPGGNHNGPPPGDKPATTN